jgi:two-component system phosphate regulon sensor histidine kinase PhoR
MRTWEVLRIPELTSALKRAIHRGENIEEEVTITLPGEDLVFDLDVSPWTDSAGRVVGAVAALHDVTQLRRLEKVRRDFVANASHELKSPITAIRGMAETMFEDPDMDREQRRQFVDSILEESIRMSSLTSDLLQLSRLEGGQLEPEKTIVDLRKLAADMVASQSQRAEGLGIEITIDQGHDELPVNIQVEGMESALNNLLENAINFTEKGGRVSVTLHRDHSRAVLTVNDTGVGIPRQHLDRIFERFYRVDKARSRELGGTGLGLSIVKHVVQSHGGEVKVSSVVGKGSRFSMYLPIFTDGENS